MALFFDINLCKGCSICVINCPKKILVLSDKVNAKGYNYVDVINENDCIKCGLCESICPDFVIHVAKTVWGL